MNLLLLGLAGCIGVAAYIAYLRFVLKRPDVLVFFVLLAWPIMEYANQALFVYTGINIHWRLILMGLFMLPAFCLLIKHFVWLWQKIPPFKYCLIFCVWMSAYFIFYNNHTIDTRRVVNSWIDSMDVAIWTAYVSLLLGIVIAAVAMLKQKDPPQFFDIVNKSLLVVSAVIALISIVGYPLGFWTQVVEGFTRSVGIYSQPNPFAHHQGMLLLYFLGLLAYYQGHAESRMPMWLLSVASVLNLIAMSLALSKTALAVFGGCAILWMLLNLSSVGVRKTIVVLLPLLAVAIGFGLWGFQILTDKSFVDILEARIDQTQSLSWRQLIWKGLLDNMDWVSVIWGHGFTSANEWVFQLTYNNRLNSKPLILVHNGYLNLLYDLGVMGLMLFVSVLVAMGRAIKQYFLTQDEQKRFVFSTIIVMSLYFLVTCYFDEMTYMFDAPLLFLILSTLLWCLYLPVLPQQEVTDEFS